MSIRQSPKVQYTYEDLGGQDSSVSEDKNVRLQKITYPNGREVYYNYFNESDVPAETKYHDRLNRIRSIASSATPTDGNPLSDDDKFAQYEYVGASTVVQVEYPDVANDPKLTRIDGTGDPYDAALDRFGRVITHEWTKSGGTVDEYTYGYDYNSNRFYHENTVTADKDELYAYDGLNRLTTFYRGDLNGGKTAIATGGDRVRGQEWTLSQTGNWSEKGDRLLLTGLCSTSFVPSCCSNHATALSPLADLSTKQSSLSPFWQTK